MPTQYELLSTKIDDLKASTDKLHEKLDAALIQQARHDEQIKVLQKGTSGALGLAGTALVSLVGAWLKSKLHS